MDKKTWWVIGVLLVLIIGAGAYVYLAKDIKQGSSPSRQAQETTEASSSADDPTQPAIKGMYAPYSPEAVANAEGDLLLFFHAPWCPQCRAVEESITTASLPDGLTILKVDYDSNQPLRQQYGVTLQTTFVKIDKKGNKIKSFVAYDEPTFEAVKRELLP